MFNRNTTPLRYPGGKSVLTEFIHSYISHNQVVDPIYVEPYCGGAGAATNLLLSGRVSEIWLNDASYQVFAFWYSIKNHGERFLEMLDQVEVSLGEWRSQRLIYRNEASFDYSEESLFRTGFATFYLNRCNRSGILHAGPIGGQTEERQALANYKIDARFNKEALTQKISALIKLSDRFSVSNQDALEFLRSLSQHSIDIQKRLAVYLDPPYFIQGSGLYMNHYEPEDHSHIAKFLKQPSNWIWLLSYDNAESIKSLYSDHELSSFYLNYSANESKLGSEIVLHSKNSELPVNKVVKTLKNKQKIEVVPL